MPRATTRNCLVQVPRAPGAPEVRSGAVALGIEPVALQPALHLLAHAPELDGDLADVAAVLLEQRDQLLAARVRRGLRGHGEPRAGDLFGQVRERDLAPVGEGGGSFERARELADVARPRV